MDASDAVRRGKTSRPEIFLTAAAGLIAVAIALPTLAIVFLSLRPQENIWPHLLNTVLPGYMWQTLELMVGVGFLTFVIGTAA